MFTTSNKNLPVAVITMLVIFLMVSYVIDDVVAAGECGKTPINTAAASLSPCLAASKDGRAKVPPACCTMVSVLITRSPRCLCAVFLSPLAKQAGMKPAIAITVPKRCNIRNRPVGKKCGGYTMP